MNTTFTVQTDKKERITVESAIIYALWKSRSAIGGGEVQCEVRTALVGEGAPVQITGKSENGKKLGKLKGKIYGNRFVGALEVPEKIERGDWCYFTVKLPKHGLKAESNAIPARPHIIVSSMKWSAQEARRGDVLTLSAQFENVGTTDDVMVVIYEYDSDGNHDPITKIPTEIVNNKLEIKWEYEYHEDTDEIPDEEQMKKYGRHYNPPEYFFVVVIEGHAIGTEQQSGLLEFKDWVNLQYTDWSGEPVPDASYTLILPDGSERKGRLDSDGRKREENIPPGKIRVRYELPDD
jgi:hypothetical protein